MGQAADELREDIERTRQDMASTMDAIGAQVSPRLQAQRQVDRLRQSGVEPKRVGMAAAAAVFGLLLVRRRRHRRDS